MITATAILLYVVAGFLLSLTLDDMNKHIMGLETMSADDKRWHMERGLCCAFAASILWSLT